MKWSGAFEWAIAPGEILIQVGLHDVLKIPKGWAVLALQVHNAKVGNGRDEMRLQALLKANSSYCLLGHQRHHHATSITR
jgi:hypothetical protein